MMNKEEALKFEVESSSIEILNTPENVKRVKELVKEYGFIKIGSSLARGSKMSYYAHSSEVAEGKENYDSYLVISWVGKWGFSPLRIASELGCDLESKRFERILQANKELVS